MKIRFAFDVLGHFRLPIARSVIVGDAVVSVELSKGRVVKRLFVTFDVPDGAGLPALKRSDEPGVAFAVDFPDYGLLKRAESIAENMQDRLSVLGVDEVDLESCDIRWIPETSEEERTLSVNDLRIHPGVREDAFAFWRSAVFREALRSNHDDGMLRLALTFFRAGWRELKSFRHAGAFIFFYFFVEALFGGNQVKKKAVVRSLTASSELAAITRLILTNVPDGSPYFGLTVQAAWERIVDRRGYLFHNQTARGRSWSNTLHEEMSRDASILCSISNEVARKRLWPGDSMPSFASMHDEKYSRFTPNAPET